jgi:alkylation response protein AidB-like acyl-CoA dehydrogenase
MERARAKRLTRNQHVLFRIGELASYVEGAAAFARHAVRAELDELNPKAPKRFAPTAVAAMARVFAREASQRVAVDGMRWTIGAEGAGSADVRSLETSAQLSKMYAAQAGLIDDMNQVGDALYGRS